MVSQELRKVTMTWSVFFSRQMLIPMNLQLDSMFAATTYYMYKQEEEQEHKQEHVLLVQAT